MGTFTIDAPDGKSYTIEGDNAQGALAALQKHLGSATPAPKTVYSGSVLPFSRDDQGGVHFDSNAGVVGLVKKAAEAAYSGATAPGDALAGKFNPPPEQPGMWSEGDQFRQDQASQEMLNRTQELAGFATPMSAARTAGEGFMGTALKSAPGKIEAPTREALATAADQGYNAVRNSPFAVHASAVSDLAKNIQGGLEKDGILGEFAPDTYTVLNKLQDPASDAFATGGNLVSAREALRQASRNFNNPREALAANRAISELDKFIEKPPEAAVLAGAPAEFAQTAADARGNYAASKRSEQIADALRGADLSTAATHSGGNLDNATRQRFKSILLSDKQSSGFSEPELAQMEQAVRGSTVADTARYAGKFLGGGGGLGALHAAGTGAVGGYAAAGPIGAAIGMTAPIAGYGLKKVADASTQKQIQLLDEMVRMRSPLAQQLLAAAPREAPQLPASQAMLARMLLGTSQQQ